MLALGVESFVFIAERHDVDQQKSKLTRLPAIQGSDPDLSEAVQEQTPNEHETSSAVEIHRTGSRETQNDSQVGDKTESSVDENENVGGGCAVQRASGSGDEKSDSATALDTVAQNGPRTTPRESQTASKARAVNSVTTETRRGDEVIESIELSSRILNSGDADHRTGGDAEALAAAQAAEVGERRRHLVKQRSVRHVDSSETAPPPEQRRVKRQMSVAEIEAEAAVGKAQGLVSDSHSFVQTR